MQRNKPISDGNVIFTLTQTPGSSVQGSLLPGKKFRFREMVMSNTKLMRKKLHVYGPYTCLPAMIRVHVALIRTFRGMILQREKKKKKTFESGYRRSYHRFGFIPQEVLRTGATHCWFVKLPIEMFRRNDGNFPNWNFVKSG